MKENYPGCRIPRSHPCGVIMPAFLAIRRSAYSQRHGQRIKVIAKGWDPKGFLDILDGQWWDHWCRKPCFARTLIFGKSAVLDIHDLRYP